MADAEVGSKRSSEYDPYAEISTQKRTRNDGDKIRLLVSGKSCGAVIGKGGENVKRLRSENSLKIKVEDSRPDGVITLGGDRSSAVSVLKEILSLITNPPYSASRNTGNRCQCEVNLLIQTDQVGAVIGKAGQKIKDIQDESGARVKVFPDCLPNSNERVVAIGGEDDARVLAAIDIVLRTLDERPLKKQVIYYDPKNKDTGGMQGNEQQHNMGRMRDNQGDVAQNQLAALGGLGLGGLAGLGGGLGGLGNLGGLGGLGASGILSQLGLGGLGNIGGGAGVGAGNDMAGGGGGGGGGYRNENRDRERGPRDRRNEDRDRGRGQRDEERREEFGDMETETKITVLNDMCGAIIGKGGETIREIRQASGAKVDFTPTEKGSNAPRVVTIKGKQKQIVIAQQMMDEIARNRKS